jgi:hypothetical protein
MIFWNKTCGFLAFFLIAAHFVSAQKVYVSKNILEIASKNQFIIKDFSSYIDNKNLPLSQPISVVPGNYYYTQHFGIMCKKELALEKVTKIPFRFRLGSLQQCNYYEGKK